MYIYKVKFSHTFMFIPTQIIETFYSKKTSAQKYKAALEKHGTGGTITIHRIKLNTY